MGNRVTGVVEISRPAFIEDQAPLLLAKSVTISEPLDVGAYLRTLLNTKAKKIREEPVMLRCFASV